MSDNAHNSGDVKSPRSPRSPRSPQSPSWQWPTCDCSEEELRALLPKADNEARRPLVRKGATDSIAMVFSLQKDDSPNATLLGSGSQLPTDSELEHQTQLQSSDGHRQYDSAHSNRRRINIWKISALLLLTIAFAEGVWIYQASCICTHSVHNHNLRRELVANMPSQQVTRRKCPNSSTH